MVLQSFYQLYDRLKDDSDYKIALSGYSLQKITFKVVLHPDGKLFGIQDLRTSVGGRMRPKQVMVPGDAKKTGSGLNPCFLWDNTGYMLGYKTDDENPTRTMKSFTAFRNKHLEAEAEIDTERFAAICRFLETWKPSDAQGHRELTEIGTGFGVFQIVGETLYVHQDPKVDAWWKHYGSGATSGAIGECLVTGKTGAIAATHQSIKGVRGAQSSGAAIVSFNNAAYESYGKTQSLNAPISVDAAFRYVTAANAILDGPMAYKHRLSIGDTTVLFWTGKPTVAEDIFAQFATEGSRLLETAEAQDEAGRKKLEVFLKALRQGRTAYSELAYDSDKTEFCILGLAPNAGRISVRFFHRSTLSDMLDKLRQHFNDIRIKPQPASGARHADPEFPPLWLLLAQTAREPKDVPPILGGPLLRAVMTGSAYPMGLYSAVIRRIRADRVINYPRACVIKGFLNRNMGKEISMSLDTERTEPAYRLGRLFAALEKTQKDALGGHINATIRDRFYGSASATPQAVIPRLLRTYQHHLRKLEGGRKVAREKLVQEILGPLQQFPTHLDLAGQGLFALGYYQQTQNFYTKKEERNANAEESDTQ